MIFYGDYTCEEHAQRRYELYHRRRHRSLHTYIIYQTAKDTSQRINIFPEYQRFLINQYIPHHTAKRAGYGSHHDRHPHGEPEIQGLGDTYHHKQPQSDSIEYKKCIVQTDHVFSESDNEQQSQGRDNQLRGLFHPKRHRVQ